MTFVKQRFFPSILSVVPLILFRKLTKTNLIIPYYHIVSDEDVLHIKHLYKYKNIRQFKEDLDFLLKHYKPISLFDVISFLKNGESMPEKTFLLTFDDGFRETHDVIAPILLEKGIPAAFFVNSAFIDNDNFCYQHKASLLVESLRKGNSLKLRETISEILTKSGGNYRDIAAGILSIEYRQKDIIDEIAQLIHLDFNDYLLRNNPYLSSNQIEGLLKQGFAIGAHSIDHPLYSLIPLQEQLSQTIECMRLIREKFRLNYGAFAFPHSDNDVKKRFFLQMHSSGLVDISFGTGGMINDDFPSHLQRFSLEKPVMPAKNIIAYQYGRKLAKQMRGDSKIVRE